MKLRSKLPLPWWLARGILFTCYQLPLCISVVATVPAFFLVSCDIALNSLEDYAMPRGGRSSRGVSSHKNPCPHRGGRGTAHGRTVLSPSMLVTSTPITATTPCHCHYSSHHYHYYHSPDNQHRNGAWMTADGSAFG